MCRPRRCSVECTVDVGEGGSRTGTIGAGKVDEGLKLAAGDIVGEQGAVRGCSVERAVDIDDAGYRIVATVPSPVKVKRVWVSPLAML